jgi:hypothetical protein
MLRYIINVMKIGLAGRMMEGKTIECAEAPA